MCGGIDIGCDDSLVGPFNMPQPIFDWYVEAVAAFYCDEERDRLSDEEIDARDAICRDMTYSGRRNVYDYLADKMRGR